MERQLLFYGHDKSFPRDTELFVITKFSLVTKLFVMTNFFLVTKLFLMTNFFLVTIFFYFATIPSSEYVNMADNNNNEMNEEDEDDLIKSYFFQGFEYKDILRFLSQYHGISISNSTLQRRLKSYDLS